MPLTSVLKDPHSSDRCVIASSKFLYSQGTSPRRSTRVLAGLLSVHNLLHRPGVGMQEEMSTQNLLAVRTRVTAEA